MNTWHSPASRWQVPAEDAGSRLDVVLARRLPNCSRRQAIRLIAEGRVRVDGRLARKGTRLDENSTLAVDLAGTTEAGALPPQALLVVTPAVLVVDKPSGVPCHALAPHEHDSLLQRVARLHPEVLSAGPDPREGGLLHRLDVDTSGAVALARRVQDHAMLRQALAADTVGKHYLAVVEDPGEVLAARGRISDPLARSRADDGRMVVQGQDDAAVRGPWLEAETRFRVLARAQGLSLVEAVIQRGRMHQIRAHLSALGHPIVGDLRYGHTSMGIGRQALHAVRLRFEYGEEVLDAWAPLPADIARLLANLGLTCRIPQDLADAAW
ncbi:MAG: RluA family pseudouridine synthase [Pseudomonadota bacterium]